MTNAFVLMTAMPPTMGHLNLIRFAASLPARRTHVIVCTQPGEPFTWQRVVALKEATRDLPLVHIHNLHRTMEQDPSAPGFWEMWDKNMTDFGMVGGDLFVTSEPYGATVAERMNGVFMPYDPNRELHPAKATAVREDVLANWDYIIPEFRQYLAPTITIFGAESTGKTTLSKSLAQTVEGHWLFEWARPYLETVGKEITRDKMMRIWEGQAATQTHLLVTKPFVIQDTDLFSTIGYWEQPHWKADLGNCPKGLISDATVLKSDLYIILKSNIPFEPDDIRYGIDKRESPDTYWLDLAEKYHLPYVIIESNDREERLAQAHGIVLDCFRKKTDAMYYDRRGL
jgi:HTH-type transcriptional regulator, transcriptional repressor of NAD biosynthesis genes